MVPMERVQAFEQTGDLDFAYEIPGWRATVPTFSGRTAAFPRCSAKSRSESARLRSWGFDLCAASWPLPPKGLVLVTGPTGSGKSTTLAALVDYANTKRRDHIITIEDPIEFVHQSKSCLVNQREIGRDSRSFGTALRSALREDPDIILVGEMRDLETISLALEAAETGHLVFATLHTISAPKTIDRIIEVFPPEEQAQIRTSLSESIQAIIAQTLFKRADKKGRVPALEIMFGIPSVRNMIRESKTFQLPSVLQTNRNVGMQTMDDDIERLLMQRIIAPEAALVHAQDKGRLREAIGKLK